MGMLNRILAPTDFSELSARGVRYACQLAKDVGAEVIIFNVVLLDETNVVNKQEVERHKNGSKSLSLRTSLAPAPV